MPLLPPPSLPASGLARMRYGARAAFDGLIFPFQHNDLFGLLTLVLGTYAAIWLALLAVAARYDQQVVQWLVRPAGTQWWSQALTAVATGAAYTLTWLLALIAAAALALPLCGPLLSLLADRVEQRFLGQAGPMAAWTTLLAEMARGLVRGLTLAVLLAIGHAWIWLMGTLLGAVLPPLGALFGLVIGWAWQALGAAAMTANYVLENQRTPLAEQLATLQRHAAIWVGFGAVALPMCWIPLGVPFAVTGATLLALRLHQAGELRMPAREALAAASAH